MAKIIGDIVGVPNPQSDCLQTDSSKADFVKNKHIFANAIRGTVSGEGAVSVDDVSPVEHELDVKVERINILPYPYANTTTTINGITFTDNGDGTITANGTATKIASYRLVVDENPASIDVGVNYTLTGCPNGGGEGKYYAFVKDVTASASKKDIGVGVNFESTSGQYVAGVWIGEGVTVNNLVFKPKLAIADSVEGVKVTRTGKNLLNLTDFIGQTVNSNGGSLAFGTDGGITGSGTPTGNVTKAFNMNVPKEKLTLSASGTFTNIRCVFYLYDESGTQLKFIQVDNTTREATIDVVGYPTYSYARIDIKRGSNDIKLSGTAYFQLEPGDTATGYEKPNAQTATANADGTVAGLTSISPNMVIQSEQGVVINAEYTVDTKTAIEKMIVEAVKKYTGVG